jgi:hypothetical protein
MTLMLNRELPHYSSLINFVSFCFQLMLVLGDVAGMERDGHRRLFELDEPLRDVAELYDRAEALSMACKKWIISEIHNQEENPNCSICFEALLASENNVVQLPAPCQHLLHADCFTSWGMKQISSRDHVPCPLCKAAHEYRNMIIRK